MKQSLQILTLSLTMNGIFGFLGYLIGVEGGLSSDPYTNAMISVAVYYFLALTSSLTVFLALKSEK